MTTDPKAPSPNGSHPTTASPPHPSPLDHLQPPLDDASLLELERLFTTAGLPTPATGRQRLHAWALCFQEWLEYRQGQAGPSVRQRALRSWFRLLRHAGKPPWDIDHPAIKAWLSAMRAEGLDPATRWGFLDNIRKFYDFARLYELPNSNSELPNPARGLRVVRSPDYANAIWLSKPEAEALLGAVDHQTSLLGQRDYALLLAFLLTGQRPSPLRNLRWGALDILPTGVWVTWRRGSAPRRELLPAEVWTAIHHYFQAAGRLAGVSETDFIFPPLAESIIVPLGLASDWDPTRPLSSIHINRLIAQYLHWAELRVDRLRCEDLRHTAIMLSFQAGATLEQIHTWQGYSKLYITRKYLRALREKQVTPERIQAAARVWCKGPFQRQKPGQQPGTLVSLQHGLYAQKLPPEQVQAALERPKGLDETIARLEVVLDRTFELDALASSPADRLKLLDILSQAAVRYGRLVKLQTDIQEQGAQTELQAIVYAALSEVHEELGLSDLYPSPAPKPDPNP